MVAITELEKTLKADSCGRIRDQYLLDLRAEEARLEKSLGLHQPLAVVHETQCVLAALAASRSIIATLSMRYHGFTTDFLKEVLDMVSPFAE